MTKDELMDLCDKHFEDWILADQEGEVVIYTGLKFTGNRLEKRYHVDKSKIYGGRENNKNVVSSTHRVKLPNMKEDKELIK